MKTPVCTLRNSFSGKHAGRVFAFTFERKNTTGKRKTSGKIFQSKPACNLAPVVKFGCGDFRNFESGKTDVVIRNFQFFVANIKAEIFAQIRLVLFMKFTQLQPQ